MDVIARDLVVRFAAQPGPALDAVSFTVATGEQVALLGASGSGKTTLLRAILAGVRPTSGVIEVSRMDVNAGIRVQREIRRRTGIIRQQDDLVTGLSARTNVLLGTAGEWSLADWAHVVCGRVPAKYRERLSVLAQSHGVTDRLDRRVEHLSGGQRQRVALLRALLPAPALLLADEPTTGLDPVTAQAAMAAIQGAVGATVIVSTHDMIVAQRFPRVLALREGRIIYDGPTPEADGLAALYEPSRASS